MTFTGHSFGVKSLAVLKNGYLASGSANGIIKIWNLNDFTFITDLKTDAG